MRALLALAAAAAVPAAAIDSALLRAIEASAARTLANHPGAYPAHTHENWDSHKGLNQWEVDTLTGGWTVGFFPHMLWQLYNITGDPSWQGAARNLTAGIAPEQYNTMTHDIGFMIFYSFGAGVELGGEGSHYRDVILRAAQSLATRYSSRVGCTQSWIAGRRCRLHKDYDARFPVIVDNMMNLELLFWSAQNGGPQAHRDMALSHARKTAANHIRQDGSTWHVVDYNPDTGNVSLKCTAQGWTDNTTWSRGQAWCIAGMTMAYRYTGEGELMETARKCAEYWINTQSFPIPPFDFEWPRNESRFRDVTAAVIAAAGLAELAYYVNPVDAGRYRRAAESMVAAATGPGFMGDFNATEGILLHGMGSCMPERSPSGQECGGNQRDVSIVYGGSFLLQALRNLDRYQPHPP
eukprot:TRINITY_DN13338_c0_g1_i1.p2 TRINITY_DN13338_c0_g1~~TRINITY_DN13338_c0_g1_i1.p2  ORF type:complete len:431 (+),score=129.52 TRINITY_DN13338_c0_g1_i1:68-1294(+)